MAYPNCVIYRACKFVVDTFLLGLQSCIIGCFRLLSATAVCAFLFYPSLTAENLDKIVAKMKGMALIPFSWTGNLLLFVSYYNS